MSHFSAQHPHSPLDIQTLGAMTEGLTHIWEKTPRKSNLSAFINVVVRQQKEHYVREVEMAVIAF